MTAAGYQFALKHSFLQKHYFLDFVQNETDGDGPASRKRTLECDQKAE